MSPFILLAGVFLCPGPLLTLSFFRLYSPHAMLFFPPTQPCPTFPLLRLPSSPSSRAYLGVKIKAKPPPTTTAASTLGTVALRVKVGKEASGKRKLLRAFVTFPRGNQSSDQQGYLSFLDGGYFTKCTRKGGGRKREEGRGEEILARRLNST